MISLRRTPALSRSSWPGHPTTIAPVGGNPGPDRRDGGFAPSFKDAVRRWRRRHPHPPAQETSFAVHYRVAWLVERLPLPDTIHLLRQALDAPPPAADPPA